MSFLDYRQQIYNTKTQMPQDSKKTKMPEPIPSRVTFLEHPVHAMMVHLPITAFLAVVVTDIVFLYTGQYFWAQASYWLAAAAAVTGWSAATVGAVDLVTVPDIRRLITGWCHAALSVMLLSLGTFNWMIRFDDPAALIWPWGLYISGLSVVMMGVTSHLGGRLVYEHGIGVGVDVD